MQQMGLLSSIHRLDIAEAPFLKQWRIPITTVAVFGVGGLTALAITIVLFVGLSSATYNTRLLWVEQSETLVESMASTIDTHLHPMAGPVTDNTVKRVSAFELKFVGETTVRGQSKPISLFSLSG